jgi:hypothetical protein
VAKRSITLEKKDETYMIGKRKQNLIYLLTLTLFAVAVLAYRLQIQIVHGPGWDPFAFLANALEFAGLGIGYSELHRPPLMSFLVSLLFRFGWKSEIALFAVDFFFILLGVVGFYLFLNLRFHPTFSFIGSLLFLSYPAVLERATSGYTDLTSVTFSIWSLYLFILAVKKNKSYLLLAFPLFLAAVLTRFTALLLVFPILLIIFAESEFISYIKEISKGVFVSFCLYLPFAYFYFRKSGDPLFPFVRAFSVVTGGSAEESFAYNPSLSWYALHLKDFIVGSSTTDTFFLLFIFLGFFGLVVYLINLLKPKGHKGFVVTFLLCVAYITVFLKGGLFFRQIAVFLLCYLIYQYFKQGTGEENRKLWLDMTALCWFLVYFDFHSHQGVKVARYFIVMAPGFTYLLLIGFQQLASVFNSISWKTFSKVLTYGILFFFLFTSLAFSYKKIEPKPDPLVYDAKQASKWLKQNDPNISQATIYSDLWPVFSWYLGQDVQAMPFFKNPQAFNHELEKFNVDYYLSIRDHDLPSYDFVKKIRSIKIFRKNPKKYSQKIRLLYLGKNWENYLEEVLDYKYFVLYDLGKYKMGKSVYVDNYSLEELSEYPLIFLYNFRWHNQRRAENLLLDYVRQGGKVVVDLSGNTKGHNYNVDASSFLGMLVERKAFPKNPNITFDEGLELSGVEFSPFTVEGKEWYGASYKKIENSSQIRSLVQVDSELLVGEQKLGEGKIYWIGYNFVWHAFISENKSEQKLIQRLVEIALGEKGEKNREN